MLSKQQYIDNRDGFKEDGFKYRERRHPEWTENYLMYRDRIRTNRLTQRQSVNIPVMKYSLNSLRKDIDDPPALYFHNLDNDSQKELFFNEAFKEYMREAKAVIKDIHDKNNGMLFGRSFKKLNIVNGVFDWEVVDPQDMNVQRYVDPAKLDTARHLIHEHIYVALAEIINNPDYDKTELKRLRSYFHSEEGLIKSSKNMQDMIDKSERMAEMGVTDALDPELGETYVELNEDYTYDTDPDDESNEILFYAVVAEDNYVLMRKPLREVLGVTEDNYWDNHFPYVTWGVDPDGTDFWCDGISDILRMPCRIINVWFSQDVERRTLEAYGMNFYDATKKNFTPQTFQPVPWGFYPLPGKPDDIIKSVFPVGQNKTNMDGINFIMSIAEKASAATTTQQGQTQKDVTLGDIKMSYSAAKDRVQSLAVFYNDAWLEFGHKYVKLIEGSWQMLGEVKITRQGKNSNKKYTKIVTPEQYLSKNGYHTEIKLITDKTQEDVEKLQKLQASAQFFQNNQKFDEIKKRKAAEFAGLNAEEVEQVMEVERQNTLNAMNNPMIQPQGNQLPTAQPQPQPMLNA